MSDDVGSRERALARFVRRAEGSLWSDVRESGLLSAPAGDARSEWQCLALHACVRGLVAAGGFAAGTAEAIDRFHAAVARGWDDARRARLVARYAEYDAIARTLASRGAHRVAGEIGAACARHVATRDAAELGALLGDLHEALAEAAAERWRRGA